MEAPCEALIIVLVIIWLTEILYLVFNNISVKKSKFQNT